MRTPRPVSTARAPATVPSRVTLSQVARKARVSLMTASYAMRNHPKIPPATRLRVQKAARKVGYVPNPEISRLMHLLRAKRLTSYQATLAFLSFSPGPLSATHPYTVDLIAGAKRRAVELGYSVDVLSVEHSKLGRARLTTMLRSRGILGVLIPPLGDIVDCSAMLDWSKFSTVAATFSAQNILVNRVMPHHQYNILQAIHELHQLGYRRLGLVLTGDLVHRVNYSYQAAIALHQQAGDIRQIPPLIHDLRDPSESTDSIRKWFRRHRPDVLLTVEFAAPLLLKALGSDFFPDTGLCVLDHSGTKPWAGIDQHPAIIGSAAVELLAGQIQHGELGFSLHPRVTMVDGQWVSGPSLRRA